MVFSITNFLLILLITKKKLMFLYSDNKIIKNPNHLNLLKDQFLLKGILK